MEKHVPEFLQSLEVQLKEITARKESLERVIEGLRDLYIQNDKVAARKEKLAGKSVAPRKARASKAPQAEGDVKAKIESLLVKGTKPAEVMKQTGAAPHVVYGINHRLKKEGKLQ